MSEKLQKAILGIISGSVLLIISAIMAHYAGPEKDMGLFFFCWSGITSVGALLAFGTSAKLMAD